MQKLNKKLETVKCHCCGDIYWPAKDVCNLLEIKDADKVIDELDDDLKNRIIFESFGDKSSDLKVQKEAKKIEVINWEGLFTLLLQSQSPVAKKFQRWVTGVVLFWVLSNNLAMVHIDFSIIDELEQIGLLPCFF